MRSREEGQATAELVALLPVLVAVGLVAWQLAVAGQAVWASHAAARAGARAAAVGADAQVAAGRLSGGARVRVAEDGQVRVSVPVRSVVGGGVVGRVTATSGFERQR